MSDELPAFLEHVFVTLSRTKHAYTATKAEQRKTKQELRDTKQELRDTKQELWLLDKRARIENSRRKQAEHRATDLEAQLKRLQDKLHSAMVALEATESARRAAESAAVGYNDLYLKARAAWQNNQCIAESREKEIACMVESTGGSSVQYRIHDVRKGKETDKQQSFVFKLATEGLLGRASGPVAVASSRMTPVESIHRTNELRKEMESRVRSRTLRIEGDRVSEARASGVRLVFKVHKLETLLHDFRVQEERLAWNDRA